VFQKDSIHIYTHKIHSLCKTLYMLSDYECMLSFSLHVSFHVLEQVQLCLKLCQFTVLIEKVGKDESTVVFRAVIMQ
jgi:hypothetical protein